MPTPDVSALTRRFRTLHEEHRRLSLARVRVLGEILEEGARRLGRKYGAWLGELCIPKTTATRYRDVYRLGQESPQLVRDNASLGPTLLAELAAFPKPERDAVLRRVGHSACRMSVREFARAARGKARAKPQKAADPAAALLAQVRALSAKLLEAAKSPPAVPRESRAVFVHELHGLCRAANILSGRIGGATRRPRPAPAQPVPPPVAEPLPVIHAAPPAPPASPQRTAPAPRPSPRPLPGPTSIRPITALPRKRLKP